ncbi:MAG: DUF2905 family protein [Geminicoccaceae bacterium]
MRRWLLVSGALLVIGVLLWPWLRQLGLGYLPGDVIVVAQGLRLGLPITTSLLIGGVISTVWWLLNPP